MREDTGAVSSGGGDLLVGSSIAALGNTYINCGSITVLFTVSLGDRESERMASRQVLVVTESREETAVEVQNAVAVVVVGHASLASSCFLPVRTVQYAAIGPLPFRRPSHYCYPWHY